MSNRLPRALLADIAAVIGSGDHASALMMLGDESGPEASAAVSSYRAQCAAALGDFDPRGHLARAHRRAPSPHARSRLHEDGTRT